MAADVVRTLWVKRCVFIEDPSCRLSALGPRATILGVGPIGR
jgi:hypothetical protein